LESTRATLAHAPPPQANGILRAAARDFSSHSAIDSPEHLGARTPSAHILKRRKIGSHSKDFFFFFSFMHDT
jgi:hypothetical protein